MKIRKGATRTVLVGKRYAFKFPAFRPIMYGGRFGAWCCGYVSNAQERTWSGQRGLNPVLFHIGPVNVYRTCAPVEELPEEFDWSAICDFEMGDRKAENLGVHPNLGIVWIDYGS